MIAKLFPDFLPLVQIRSFFPPYATVWSSKIEFMKTYQSLSRFVATSCVSQLLKSSEGPLLRRRRHLESSKSYIAAKLLSLPTTFTLGDKKNYNGFYNKPLNTDQEYLSFVMAVLHNNETDSTANYVSLTCTHHPTSRSGFKERGHLEYIKSIYQRDMYM